MEEDVVVPDYYNGRPVISIGLSGSGTGPTEQKTGFCNNKFIKNVTLPKYLCDIYDYAFLGCTNLINVDDSQVAGSYSLHHYVFTDTQNFSAFTLSLKNSLFYLDTFSYSSLEEITIDRGIGYPATSSKELVEIFQNCSQLQKITVNCNQISNNLCLAGKTTLGVRNVIFKKPEFEIPNKLLSGLNRLTNLTLPKLDRNIVDYFGEEEMSVDLKMDNYSGHLNIPDVENLRVVETEELKKQFYSPYLGTYYATMEVPSKWEVIGYWFKDKSNNDLFFDDQKESSFSYSSYSYANKDAFEGTRITYPSSLRGYFSKLPRTLNINVLKHVENEDAFLLNTGFKIDK